MKKIYLLGSAFLVSAVSLAQHRNQDPYPGYNHVFSPDWSLMRKVMKTPNAGVGIRTFGEAMSGQLPSHFNNADYPYFPPIFSQGGYGSCGVSSHVGYMMTSEMNCYANTDASLPVNQLTPMFEYPFTYNGPGKDDAAINFGFPNAVIYGGRYESSIYGGSEYDNDSWGWGQGYDLFYNAMQHRITHAANFPLSVGTPEGAAAVKWWLYNHSGDPRFGGRGGICCIGVGISNSELANIPNSSTNSSIGVVGKKYMRHWRTDAADHAMTIVGYDDRVEFDLDGNGVAGEEQNQLGQNEKGAWIIANSWGNTWANAGFVYCPYAMGGPLSEARTVNGKTQYVLKNNDYWKPYVYFYRCGYAPQRTMKVLMSYIGRSEISVQVGVAQDTTATNPEATRNFRYIDYTGDGVHKDGKDAPTPLLGRWADGKMHYEPMEFGVDLTDLTAGFDARKPLKYFLIINSKPSAVGVGGIHKASVIDYEFNPQGNEVPMPIVGEGDSVQIKNHGEVTMISVVVPGESLNNPLNLTLAGSTLNWEAPMRGGYPVKEYQIYQNGSMIAITQDTHYMLDQVNGVYFVKAVYVINGRDVMSEASNSVGTKDNTDPYDKDVVELKDGGFKVPGVADKGHKNFTIEYWMKPTRLRNWNQVMTGYWGTYMIHANADGSITAGWDLQNRISTVPNAYKVNMWKHYAIVVEGNKTTIYVNGIKSRQIESQHYNGFPALGDLIFGNSGHGDRISGVMDELRIWGSARTGSEIRQNMRIAVADPRNTPNLLAYYKMDVIHKDGKAYLRDAAHGHDASFINDDWKSESLSSAVTIRKSADKNLKTQIVLPHQAFLGSPVQAEANSTLNAYSYTWKADNATPAVSDISSPSFIFNKLGQQQVQLIVANQSGDSKDTVKTNINIVAPEVPTAEFKVSEKVIKGSDRVSFIPLNHAPGCTYKWEMEGAEVPVVHTTLASATYTSIGEKVIKLTVTSPDGQVYTSEQTIKVLESAPKAAVKITPAIVVKGRTVELKDMSSYAPKEAYWTFISSKNQMTFKGLNQTITPTIPGVYDLYYYVGNDEGNNTLEQSRALIVCNADSYNGLTINGTNRYVTAQVNAPSSDQYSIDFWMKPVSFSQNSNGIYLFNGNDTISMYANTLGGLEYRVAGKSTTVKDYFIKDEWHHYAITASRYGTVTFYRDGVKIGNVFAVGARDFGHFLKTLRIGKSNANEISSAASFDEFRLWTTALTESQICKYCVAPIADADMQEAKDKGLCLYYQFNQSTGNVIDKVTGEATGIRTNFGPDGDSWIDSKGVFSIYFGSRTLSNPAKAGAVIDKSSYRVFDVSDEEVALEKAPAGYAIDGAPSTLWHSHWSNGGHGYPHVLTLIRANEDVIKGMSITYNRNDYYRAGQVTISESDDAKKWSIVDYHNVLDNKNNSGLVFTNPITKKYIRFEFLKGMAESSFLAINELNLFGEEHQLDKKECTLDFVGVSDQASTTNGGDKAVDTQTSTYWTTTSGSDYPHSIVLKSHDGKPFDLVEFNFSGNNSAHLMDIYQSDDNKNWTLLTSDVRIPFINNGLMALSDPVRKTYVKFVFKRSRSFTSDQPLQIREIKAYTTKKLASGISDVEIGKYLKPDTDVYDLQGRNLGKDASVLPAGVYIQNGKKVLIK